jgi:serine/threonine protein kinase
VSEASSIIAGPGLRVGEYVLDEKIGHGAFGEVWKAHHRAWTEQFAAVKIPTDPAYLRQLQSEGFSLYRLTHPNVVRVIGFDPAATPPYLMTELVGGPSLRQLLLKGRLSVAKSVAIFRQILAGLAYAHSRGAVHGDLKPENVLLEKTDGDAIPDGAVKLADFGVGMVSAAAALGAGSSSLLRGDRTVGTLAYLAPEQREGSPPDAKSDLFACGVMLFELLTGERPGGAEPPSELNPAVPTALDDVFRHAYARRDRRFVSANEFLTALNTASAKLPPEPVAAALTPAPVQAAEDIIIGLRPDEDQDSDAGYDVAEPEPLPPPSPVKAPFAAPTPLPPPPAQEQRRPAVKPPAQRGVIVIDEMARRPVRTLDDLRALFRRIYLAREMEPGEVANLRVRLDQWAESVGGMPGFGERIQIEEALDCPYYRVGVTTRYEQPDGQYADSEGAVVLANPSAAQDCGRALASDDFSVLLHLSTGVFPTALLEMISVPVIRSALANLLTAAKAQAAGRRITRQELKLSRANVLSLRYTYESTIHGACFAGNHLQVVSPSTPVTKMREDVLKRAASLLDTDNIGAGINELRQMFLTSNSAQPRAERMLIALRAKLSAAYIALARATAANLGAFESLAYSTKAAELQPGNEEAAAHEQRVRKLSVGIQAGPGIAIGLVFGLIALFTRPLYYGYIAAALGAVISGIYAWYKLRDRTARTDVAFCHACLLPLALAAVLATFFRQINHVSDDVAALVLVVLVIVVDMVVFRNYGYWLLRPTHRQNLAGQPLDVLNQVQTMLEPDWDKLRTYYLALGPLYKHASARFSEPAPPAHEPPPMEQAEPDIEEI